MAENQLNENLKALLNGLDGFSSSKTVVGNPITVNDTVLIPLMDMQVGIGVGAYSGKTNSTAGGMGAKMTPNAVLMIKGDSARLINIKNQDSITKVLDMVPDVVDKIKSMKNSKTTPEVDEKIEEIKKEAK